MANDDIKSAIEAMLREKYGTDHAEVHVVEVEHDYRATDDDPGNASTLLDRSLASLDRMADNGAELATLLAAHKRFISNVFGQLGAVIIKNGGEVRLTKAELENAMENTTMAGTWDGDTLVLVAKKDTIPS